MGRSVSVPDELVSLVDLVEVAGGALQPQELLAGLDVVAGVVVGGFTGLLVESPRVRRSRSSRARLRRRPTGRAE
jgi:hypothetical protein